MTQRTTIGSNPVALARLGRLACRRRHKLRSRRGRRFSVAKSTEPRLVPLGTQPLGSFDRVLVMKVLADGGRPLQDKVGAGGSMEVISVSTGTGDRDAEFSVFMERSAPGLARTAWLLCGDEHRAEELVQQAFMRTYLSWSVARQRDPLAYTRRTLANLRIDSWRKRRREVLMDPRDIPEGSATGGAQVHADRDQLVRALATLSLRQRRIVVLRHLDGLSEREVAETLGVSIGTVKSTASRGVAHLRDELSLTGERTPGNDTPASQQRSRS
jgi:RNA polymerase sigma-70 factor (sigma-E family)